MRLAVLTISVALTVCCSAASVCAQQASSEVKVNEPRVPLTEQAPAFDIAGQTALGARLRTTTLSGTPDAPVRDVRIVIENRSPLFYTYVSGWATFYGADNVRCGEGAWKLEALAPGEAAEVDTPGLRLTCTPASWRITATNLLTRTGDVAKPNETALQSAPASTSQAAPANTIVVPPLEININGKTLPLQLGNPVEFKVGKETVRIVVSAAP